MLQRLPLTISSFRVLRTTNCLYIDKTKYVHELITGHRRYFLSRPRRFGKSLLVSTLKEALAGNKELFEGLCIAQSDYQWQSHAVITIDFSTLKALNGQVFESALVEWLYTIAQQYHVSITSSTGTVNAVFKQLLLELHKKYGYIAVLIDEYDRPLLHNLHNLSVAREIRTIIQDFFSIIKSEDDLINFVFITGVSAFTKSGLFSGINNLQIMTLDQPFATICGYTDEEIDHYYVPHIQAWADKKEIPYTEIRQKVQEWYNGYRFGYQVPSVYNPFSLMNALEKQQFINFWFESGTPTFLVKILKKEHQFFDPENIQATYNLLGTFDIDTIPLTALMFQSGYLTITDYNEESRLYTLDYPNYEVETSLQKYLFATFAHFNANVAEEKAIRLKNSLNNGEIAEAISTLKQLFAQVPYQLHIPQEKFYHALLQMIFSTAGMKSQSEYSTSHGRIDIVLDLPKALYIIEVKFNDSAKTALAQIEKQRYHESFTKSGKPVVLMGLSFNREPHNFDITYVTKTTE